jgi:UDP-N-acetylglucosamine 4,6-dehydratase/5-epimerase
MSLWPSLMDTPPDLRGKVILVTGGTGSFGRAFVTRVLAEHEPAKLIVFSRDEQKHFAMQRELDDPRLRFFVGDIRDRTRLLRALRGVDIVIHAAAMKHVPLAEYNPIEAIRTNVDGAANLIDAALEREVEIVVGLSTDKAASPVNLYGATKLCMEKLLVAANSYSGASGPSFRLVRYGNVVGSKGSVLPVFMDQRETGTLTLTEPSMTRFWIRMDQAIDLVMLTLQTGQGGEVFVPKIPACTVQTLADAVAPAAAKQVIGIRPGEKIHELMITVDESRNVLEYDRYFVITPSFPWWGGPKREGKPVPAGFGFSSDIAEQLDAETVRAMLRELGYAV